MAASKVTDFRSGSATLLAVNVLLIRKPTIGSEKVARVPGIWVVGGKDWPSAISIWCIEGGASGNKKTSHANELS